MWVEGYYHKTKIIVYEWFIKFLEWAEGTGFSPPSRENLENNSADLADLCHNEGFEELENCLNNCLYNHTFSATIQTSKIGTLSPASLPPVWFCCSWHQTLPRPGLPAKAGKIVEAESLLHGVHVHLPSLVWGCLFGRSLVSCRTHTVCEYGKCSLPLSYLWYFG